MAYYKDTTDFKVCMAECDDFGGNSSYTDYN